MSYSPTSNLVFGLPLDSATLEISTKVLGCKHNCDLTANFCSVCGEPVYKEEISEIAENDSFYDIDTIGFFKSSCYSTYGILGIPLLRTQDQDTGYYVVPKPTEDNIKQVKQLLFNKNCF